MVFFRSFFARISLFSIHFFYFPIFFVSFAYHAGIMPILPTFFSFLEFCRKKGAYVVVGYWSKTFFYPPVKIKSLIWEYFVHLWAYVVVELLSFSLLQIRGIPASAFHAGINPKFLNRVQLVPLFKSYFIQCYRLTPSSYYWWCTDKGFFLILQHSVASPDLPEHINNHT